VLIAFAIQYFVGLVISLVIYSLALLAWDYLT